MLLLVEFRFNFSIRFSGILMRTFVVKEHKRLLYLKIMLEGLGIEYNKLFIVTVLFVPIRGDKMWLLLIDFNWIS